MKDFLWWKHGVIYQIYPRSYYDSNTDGIGDIDGIREKLDYISDLGVDAIWLSPIYPSPDIDYGYDVSDYCEIDPKFGKMKDFDNLVREAHDRKIKIIMDLVLNHTSDQHPWFLESKKSKDNPFRDYYLWEEPDKNGKEPNNWLSMIGGSGWEFDESTGQYYFHHFFKEQPDLNWRNPKVRESLLNVFRFWLNNGVDGFRLDIFNAYFKHEDFRNNPRKFLGLRPHDRMFHIFDMDQPEMIPLLMEIRDILNSYPDAYVVGETFLDTIDKASSYCGDELLHAAFFFKDFLGSPWKPKRFLKAIEDWENALNNKAWPNYVLSNHDVIRAASRYGIGEDDERLKVAAAMLLTLRGTPFIYYGQEIGMREKKLKKHEILDPVGKFYWPFYKGRDGCRTPMQWNESENAGFSRAQPWLPVHEDWIFRNVKRQLEEPDSLLNFYKDLLILRKEYKVLMVGKFERAIQMPAGTLLYFRCQKEEGTLIALNFCKHKRIIDLQINGIEEAKLILSNKQKTGEIFTKRFQLLENEAAIFSIY